MENNSQKSNVGATCIPRRVLWCGVVAVLGQGLLLGHCMAAPKAKTLTVGGLTYKSTKRSSIFVRNAPQATSNSAGGPGMVSGNPGAVAPKRANAVRVAPRSLVRGMTRAGGTIELLTSDDFPRSEVRLTGKGKSVAQCVEPGHSKLPHRHN